MAEGLRRLHAGGADMLGPTPPIKDIKSVRPNPSAITTGEITPLTNPLVWGSPAIHLMTSIAPPMPTAAPVRLSSNASPSTMPSTRARTEPNACKRPISLVRSITAVIIVLRMVIPPTIRAMPEVTQAMPLAMRM